MPLRVYVTGTGEDWLPFEVLRHSIRSHGGPGVEVHAIDRAADRLGPLPGRLLRLGVLAFQRLVVPELAGRRGRAICMGPDMLVLGDLGELGNMPLDEGWLAAAPQPDGTGIDLSLFLVDCERAAWDARQVVADLVRRGASLRGLPRLDVEASLRLPESVAALARRWNSADAFEEHVTVVLRFANATTRPWLARGHPLEHLWLEALVAALEAGAISLDDVRREVEAGHVRPSLYPQARRHSTTSRDLPEEVCRLDRDFIPPGAGPPRRPEQAQAEPLPEAQLYAFLRSHSEEELRQARFHSVELLLKMAPVARAVSFPEFYRRLADEAGGLSGIPEGFFALNKPATPRHRKAVEAFRSLLAGKRVAVVGPSKSIAGSRRAALIESYDLVVRLNSQWPVRDDLVPDVGSRMDVLYHACTADLPIEKLVEAGLGRASFVLWQRNQNALALEAHCQRLGVPSLDVRYVYERLFDAMGTWPNTGTVAIAHLLQSGCRELYVTGITFYREGYYRGYEGEGADPAHWQGGVPPSRIGAHEFLPQLRWFAGAAARDSRIVVDRALGEILVGVDPGLATVAVR